MDQPLELPEPAPSFWAPREVAAWTRSNQALAAYPEVVAALQGRPLNGTQLLALTSDQAVRQRLGLREAPACQALVSECSKLHKLEADLSHQAVMAFLFEEAMALVEQTDTSPDQKVAARWQVFEAHQQLHVYIRDADLARSLEGDMQLAARQAMTYEQLRQQEQQDAAVARRLAAGEQQPLGAQPAAAAATAVGRAAEQAYQAQLAAARGEVAGAGADAAARGGGGRGGAGSSFPAAAVPAARGVVGGLAGTAAVQLPPIALAIQGMLSGRLGSSTGGGGSAARQPLWGGASSAAAGSTSGGSTSGSTSGSMGERLARRQQLVQDGLLRVVEVSAARIGRGAIIVAAIPKVHPRGKGKAVVPGSAWGTMPGWCRPEDTCVACYDSFLSAPDIRAQLRLPCGHSFCEECMATMMRQACSDAGLLPVKCCRQAFDDSLAEAVLDARTAQMYRERCEEHTAVRKMYCTNKACSKFINIDKLHQTTSPESYACECGQQLCLNCCSWSHPGMTCKQFQGLPDSVRSSAEDLQAVALAKACGWQRCPSCKYFVSLQMGCYHMTCRCSYQFCYMCAAPWKTCGCEHWEERHLLREGQERVAIQERATGQVLGTRERERHVATAMAQLRTGHNTCSHEWVRRQPTVANVCGRCGFSTNWYCFYCQDCHMAACHVCRYFRIR